MYYIHILVKKADIVCTEAIHSNYVYLCMSQITCSLSCNYIETVYIYISSIYCIYCIYSFSRKSFS